METETLDGKEMIDIAAGTAPGTQVVLRGKGIPFLRSSGRGHHRLTIQLDTPKKLSREQRQLIEHLREQGL